MNSDKSNDDLAHQLQQAFEESRLKKNKSDVVDQSEAAITPPSISCSTGLATIETSDRDYYDYINDFSTPLNKTEYPVQPKVGVSPEKPIPHDENIEYMTQMYGFDIRWNQITKEIDWIHHGGLIDNDTDNANEQLITKVASLLSINKLKVPTGINVGSVVISIADRHQKNEVVECLSALVWDGVRRLDTIADHFSASDKKSAAAALRVFFLSACAAGDAGQIGCSLNVDAHPSYEYILVLVSSQGKNKTKGLRRLLPRLLRHLFGEAIVLDLKNKDSKKEAISHWIAELGELDATFKKSDIAHLKGFVSSPDDTIRLPYGRAWSKFGRRTVFVATVNQSDILMDETGNRRFMPLSISQMPTFDDSYIHQLWAEAWHRYTSGEQWWPTEQEEIILADAVREFEKPSVEYENLVSAFDWFSQCQSLHRTTASDIWKQYVHTGRERNPSSNESTRVRAAMKKLWLENSASYENGELTVIVNGIPQKCYTSGGNNRGWLLPPARKHQCYSQRHKDTRKT